MTAPRERPYTPETLAERWGCSAQHVRDMIAAKQIPAFRIGRLWRISAEAVCQHETKAHNIASSSTEASGPSPGEKAEKPDARHSASKIVRMPSADWPSGTVSKRAIEALP